MRWSIVIYAILFVVFRGGLGEAADGRKPLYVGGLFPLSEKDGWSRFFGYGSLKGVERAISDINNRTDVLPGYELVLIYNDTEGDKVTALNKLYDLIYQPPTKVLIYGPHLSSVTESVAEVAGRWALVEMAPSSTPVLSKKLRYPYVYRMLVSAAGFSYAHVEIFRQFNWTNFATLHETSEPHAGVTVVLQQLAENNSLTLIAAESFLTDPYEAMQRLKARDVRIIAANFYESVVRKVFCSAYKLGMYGKKYVWLIPGYFADRWWQVADKEVTCTPDELKRASEGYLTVTWSMFGREELPTIAEVTPAEYRRQMEPVVGRPLSDTDRGTVAVSYDGMWALARGLHEAEAVLARPLDSFYYGDTEYADAVGRAVQRQDFEGVSGHVSFSKDGDILGTLLIEQHRDGVETAVGAYDKNTDSMSWLVDTSDIWYYNGGIPPFDSDTTRTITLLRATPMPIMITMCVLSSLGIVFAVCFFVFNVLKRQNRQVKMSSPKVNNLIAVGITLAYLCVILMGVDISMVNSETLLTVCTTRSWFLALCFTIAFGGMFTKMWRVYSIVIHNKTKRKVIKDYHLFIIIGVLLLVDFVILIPWQIFDPMQIEEERVLIPQTVDDIEMYRKYEQLHVKCTSTNDTIWTMALIIYKAFVVVFGAFLAWSTRNVNVPGLNDSYYVGLSIYNTVICCVVAVPLSLLNVSSIGVTYALVSGFLLLCTTMSLCMLFIPKVIAVYKKNAVGDDGLVGTMVGTVNRRPETTFNHEALGSRPTDDTSQPGHSGGSTHR
ncbi:gamma-aminobutyric acid type B receptor subunit 2-like [Asterias amurensis]|uniref:gamma-aminobutyric acid type B receptor subunit 2-like n=1 Tax=Asterias amurensis TaxID=7602 RepID=UPI003AB1E98D